MNFKYFYFEVIAANSLSNIKDLSINIETGGLRGVRSNFEIPGRKDPIDKISLSN